MSTDTIAAAPASAQAGGLSDRPACRAQCRSSGVCADRQFDRRLGCDAFGPWARAHQLIAATLEQETGLLSGARFGRVALETYQLAPALRLISKPRPTLLIADDVGLGKTIEAGLAMLERLARKRASRILIVTPPGLLLQWQDELREKFGLEFTLIEDAAGLSRVQSQLPAGTSPWDALPRVLTSLDFLKKETVCNRALRKRWHPVIVDEAHALAESGTPEKPYRTQPTRLGAAIQKNARGSWRATVLIDDQTGKARLFGDEDAKAGGFDARPAAATAYADARRAVFLVPSSAVFAWKTSSTSSPRAR